MINTLLIIFVWISSLAALSAAEDDEPITVRLATENQLMPLFLAKFEAAQSGFDPSYIAQLENILQFDLNNNGMTYTVPQEGTMPVMADFEDLGDAAKWKTLHIFYVIKAKVADKKLAARMLMVNAGSFKSVEGIALTGDLSRDRRQMHQLADTIHKTLFGSDGVATTKIIYTVKKKIGANQWTSEVWEADYDGGNARQLTNNSGYCVTPVYIPPKPGFAAGSFLYVSYKGGQSKIYVASLKDGVGRRLSLLKGNQMMPTINRQRDNIAFISDYTGNPDLFLLPFSPEAGATGKPQQIYATHKATQGTPTFHPDGHKVAFVSNKDGSPRIYVMDIPAPGTSLKDISAKLITKRNRESSAPAWSPDGSKIAYCSMSNGARQIWVYDFDKKEERQLTQGAGNKENPTWAPNSLHLMFNSTGGDSSELYLINLNQPAAYQLRIGGGEKRFPSWEPR